MAVCGLPLHPGSSESRKTLEQEFFFRIGTLNLKEAPLWVPRHTTLIAQRIFYLVAHALVILFVGLMDQRYEPKMQYICLLFSLAAPAAHIQLVYSCDLWWTVPLSTVDVVLKVGRGANGCTLMLLSFCGDVDCCFFKNAPGSLFLIRLRLHFPALG